MLLARGSLLGGLKLRIAWRVLLDFVRSLRCPGPSERLLLLPTNAWSVCVFGCSLRSKEPTYELVLFLDFLTPADKIMQLRNSVREFVVSAWLPASMVVL